jgi:hypothetical protein
LYSNDGIILFMEQSFNAEFYIAAATVIPLLYLALLTTSSWFIRTYVAIEKGEQQLIKKEWPKQKILGSVFNEVFTIIIKCIFWLVFFAGSVGEISALMALDRRASTPTLHKLVIISLYTLIIWVTLNSIAIIARKSTNK